MPTLSEKHLKEILEAFAGRGDNPSKDLIEALADLSGKLTDNISDHYEKLYKEINDTENGPFDPIPPIIG